MKEIQLFLFAIFFLMNTVVITAQVESTTLRVKLINFNENGHQVRVGLCDSPNDWLKTGVDGKSVLVKNGEATVVFEDLPVGKYALSCYYDINGNNELDTGLFGIPKEPYAFSNNPSTMFGPPKFKNAAVVLAGGKKEITIKF